MAEEQFATTQHSFADIEDIMAHLEKQDAELLKHTDLLLKLVEKISERKET